MQRFSWARRSAKAEDMVAYRFDEKQSSLLVETRAKGMLAKLAHDLSIEVREPAVTLTVTDGKASLELGIDVAKLRVDGVRKGESVDRGVLSSSDRADIEKKIQREVFNTSRISVKLDASSAPAAGTRNAEIEASGRLEAGRGSTRVSSRVRLEVRADGVVATARAKVSLPSLGIAPPKGPLGAFRVDDDVEIVAKLAFVPG